MLLLDRAHQSNAVGLIVDGERPVQSHCLAVTAQHAHACRVERRHPHALGGRPDERFETVFHLARRLVGECDGQDLAWPGVPLAQCPCDAAGEHARLARPCARADEQRGARVLHGFGLLGVQPIKQFFGAATDDGGFCGIDWHGPSIGQRLENGRFSEVIWMKSHQ